MDFICSITELTLQNESQKRFETLVLGDLKKFRTPARLRQLTVWGRFFEPILDPNFYRKTPDARFELATNGLTVRCSTAELIRNKTKLEIKVLSIFGAF